MSGSEAPFVSVIIPVFNDGDRLQLCLAALAEQTYARSRFEIIVVDNGSDDLDLIKAMVADYDNAALAVEPIPGSYAARNRGLEVAKGEAIAFTDADCIPDSDWLERGVARLCQEPNCGQVVGRINLFFADPQRPTAVELYESLTAFPQERLLREQHGGATANVLTWRRVIDRVGPFDLRLKSNGDLEWGRRVFEAGFQQVYADEVQVGHPARRSLGELHKRTVRLAGGYYDVQLKQAKSLGQRQWVFVQALLQNLVPPVFFVVNAFGDGRLKHLDQKLKVSSVMVMVRYITAWETLRLKFGGASSRS
ncbi:glycosyltransferase family 2 protein [Leptolyngbya sp. CCNP1308]|uniref:glycosyltransferase n=1 Tax=Leptolyngbya sp. CCNP1308 TaxID=3110255 RepID=UPI002B1F99CB|nr:glycosyltransferase family 2 protein [Leptolyngbya sp. CCNP1308]MEA5450988.1 glycosyltransferase family 2 protein [Leptolyngbya sp. CCNP1308]